MTRSNAKKRILAEISKDSWNSTVIRNILDELVKVGKIETIDISTILSAASLSLGTPISDIKRSGNQRINVMARGFCYLRLREEGYTVTEIGNIFGRCHSAVSIGVKTITQDLNYKAINDKYINFKEQLNK